jgi:SAM-dependent methyltransferase
MPFDPVTLAGRDLRGLRAALLDAGYRTDVLAELLGLPDTEALLIDVARVSLIRCELLDSSCPAILGKLFLLCAPVPVDVFDKLPEPLAQALRENDLVRIDSDGNHVTGTVSITEFNGFYYLADRLFENRSGRITVGRLEAACMPPHASSFEIMKVIGQVPSGSTVLDVGCGSGFQSVPLSRSADLVAGIDISDRAVTFARANARLNGVAAQFETAAWEDYDARQRFSRVIFNAPNAAAGSRFVSAGVPRFLAPGGCAQVWATCEVLACDGDVLGAVSRMCTVEPPLSLNVVANDESPFSLSREAIRSGTRPRHTLLVEHPSQWRAYLDSLRSRGVVEVVSAVIEVR